MTRTKKLGISVFQKSLIHCTQLIISTVVSGQGSRNGSQKHRKRGIEHEKADDGYDPDGSLYDSRWRGERRLPAASRMRSDLPLGPLKPRRPVGGTLQCIDSWCGFGPAVDGPFRL